MRPREACDSMPDLSLAPTRHPYLSLAGEVPSILGVAHPVVDVDVGHAAEEELQLLEVEDRQQRLGDHLNETTVSRLRLEWRSPGWDEPCETPVWVEKAGKIRVRVRAAQPWTRHKAGHGGWTCKGMLEDHADPPSSLSIYPMYP